MPARFFFFFFIQAYVHGVMRSAREEPTFLPSELLRRPAGQRRFCRQER